MLPFPTTTKATSDLPGMWGIALKKLVVIASPGLCAATGAATARQRSKESPASAEACIDDEHGEQLCGSRSPSIDRRQPAHGSHRLPATLEA